MQTLQLRRRAVMLGKEKNLIWAEFIFSKGPRRFLLSKSQFQLCCWVSPLLSLSSMATSARNYAHHMPQGKKTSLKSKWPKSKIPFPSCPDLSFRSPFATPPITRHSPSPPPPKYSILVAWKILNGLPRWARGFWVVIIRPWVLLDHFPPLYHL